MTRHSTKDVLRYVERYIRVNGYAPSVDEVARGMSMLSKSTASYHLTKLRAAGAIVWEPGIARSIRVVGEVKA